MHCPYAEHGICQVATRLANMVVPLREDACNFCQADLVPMSTNKVTASIAATAQITARGFAEQDLLRMATGRFDLAGYVVERHIHRWLRLLRITPPANCGCEEWVRKMNAWGIQGSLDHLDEIAGALFENLKLTYLAGVPSVISSRLTIALIKRVIRRCLSRRLM